MKLTQSLADKYCKEQKSALEAQRLAQEIAFAPMVFQVSRLMVKFGILEYLSNQLYEKFTPYNKLSNEYQIYQSYKQILLLRKATGRKVYPT